MNSVPEKMFSVGEFLVDPRANLLKRKTVEKRLEPKLITLLCFLAKSQGEVVSREQLSAAVWPGVVVGDETVTRAIFALRNALGDDAKQPRYIETISKRGYRFLVDPEPFVSVDEGKTGFRYWPWLALVSIVAVVAGLMVMMGGRESALEIDKILPITKSEGREMSVSIHRPSQTMAYAYHIGPGADIYTHSLVTGDTQRITDDEWIEFSPIFIDESSIVYIRVLGSEWQVVRKLIAPESDTLEPEVLYKAEKPIGYPSFAGPSSRFIWFNEFVHSGKNDVISLDLITGKSESLRTRVPNLPSVLHRPYYIPEKNILYILNEDAKTVSMMTIDLNTFEFDEIASGFDYINGFEFISERRLIVSGKSDSTEGIWTYDLDTQEADILLLASGAEGIGNVMLDMANDTIYYETSRKDFDVQVIFPGANNPVERFPKLNSNGIDVNSVFSASGKYVYFVSSRSGYFELWAYNRESEQARVVTSVEGQGMLRPVISDDDKYAALVYESEKLRFAVFDLATGKALSDQAIPKMRYPLSWSRDGKSIYVSEHFEHVNLYRYDRDTLESELIQEYAGLYARENANGETLMYMDYAKKALVKVDLSTGEVVDLTGAIKGLDNLAPGQLVQYGDRVYATYWNGEENLLISYPLVDDGKSEETSHSVSMVKWGGWITDIRVKKNGEIEMLYSELKLDIADVMKIELKK